MDSDTQFYNCFHTQTHKRTNTLLRAMRCVLQPCRSFGIDQHSGRFHYGNPTLVHCRKGANVALPVCQCACVASIWRVCVCACVSKYVGMWEYTTEWMSMKTEESMEKILFTRVGVKAAPVTTPVPPCCVAAAVTQEETWVKKSFLFNEDINITHQPQIENTSP